MRQKIDCLQKQTHNLSLKKIQEFHAKARILFYFLLSKEPWPFGDMNVYELVPEFEFFVTCSAYYLCKQNALLNLNNSRSYSCK